MTYDSYSIIKQGLFSQNPTLVPQFIKKQLSTFTDGQKTVGINQEINGQRRLSQQRGDWPTAQIL